MDNFLIKFPGLVLASTVINEDFLTRGQGQGREHSFRVQGQGQGLPKPASRPASRPRPASRTTTLISSHVNLRLVGMTNFICFNEKDF